MSYDATTTPEEQLLLRVRAGDSDAYQALYSEHADDARKLARILVGNDQADELVSESFARVLASLKGGGGPTENFRSYLHVTIRNGYRDSLRATQEAPVSDQPWLLDEAEPAVDEMVEGLDESVAKDALATLPERWQQVLWHVEVEGRKPAEVAELMDLAPRTVSSLAHRAREGLKLAYLDLHAGPVPTKEDCRWVHARMSQSARGDLSARAQGKLDQHLDDCPDCAAAFLVVGQVNSKLAAYVLPIILLGAASGSKALAWLVGGAAAGGAAAGAAGGSGGAASGGSTLSGPVAVGAVAAVAVVGIAAGGFALAAHHHHQPPAPKPTAAHAAPPHAGPAPAPAAHAAPKPKPKPAPASAPMPSAAPTSAGPAPTSRPHQPKPSQSSTPTASSTPTSSPSPTPKDCTQTSDPCTGLGTVGVSGSGPWTVTAPVSVLDGGSRTITVKFAVNGPVGASLAAKGAGWTCSGATTVVLGSAVTCTTTTSSTPSPVALTVGKPGGLFSLLAPGPASGTVSMSTDIDGDDASSQSFTG